jgi:membrane-bound serine protease (ClpP class)
MMFSSPAGGQVVEYRQRSASAILRAMRVATAHRAAARRPRASMLALAAAFLAASGLAAATEPAAGPLLRLRLDSIVHPIAKDFLVSALADADRRGAAALIVELDTPGGLLSSTREMTTAMLGAKTPVVVWVGPDGAQAASAGFFLLQAADFAVMAPSTNTGAAHPVGAGGSDIEGHLGAKAEQDAAATIRALAARRGRNVELAEKAVVESRSFTAREALDENLIDLVAGSLPELVAALDGREYEKPEGEKRTLALAGRVVESVELPFYRRFLSRIAHPDLAGILLTLGMLGIYFELSHPGAIFPGVLGGICLLLAFAALSVLPVNYVGVALVVLAVVLFVAEIKVTSYGALALGGIISLVLGLAMLFQSAEPALRVSWSLIAVLAATAALLVAGGVLLIARTYATAPAAGEEAMIGTRVVARTALTPAGKLFLLGEWWNAVADGEVAAGEEVEVFAVDGLTLRVRRTGARS